MNFKELSVWVIYIILIVIYKYVVKFADSDKFGGKYSNPSDGFDLYAIF